MTAGAVARLKDWCDDNIRSPYRDRKPMQHDLRALLANWEALVEAMDIITARSDWTPANQLDRIQIAEAALQTARSLK